MSRELVLLLSNRVKRLSSIVGKPRGSKGKERGRCYLMKMLIYLVLEAIDSLVIIIQTPPPTFSHKAWVSKNKQNGKAAILRAPFTQQELVKLDANQVIT